MGNYCGQPQEDDDFQGCAEICQVQTVVRKQFFPVSRPETGLAQSGVNQLLESAMDYADRLDRLVFIVTLISALVANFPW